MITLKEFKNIFKHIELLESKNKQLTEIIVCKDSSGWVNHGENLIDDIFMLLHHSFNIPVEYKLFEWWKYDARDGRKYIFEESKKIKYNLNSLDNLYLYARGERDKVVEPYTEDEIKEYKKRKSTQAIVEHMLGGTEDFIKQIWG
jgi:hypothetical protein